MRHQRACESILNDLRVAYRPPYLFFIIFVSLPVEFFVLRQT